MAERSTSQAIWDLVSPGPAPAEAAGFRETLELAEKIIADIVKRRAASGLSPIKEFKRPNEDALRALIETYPPVGRVPIRDAPYFPTIRDMFEGTLTPAVYRFPKSIPRDWRKPGKDIGSINLYPEAMAQASTGYNPWTDIMHEYMHVVHGPRRMGKSAKAEKLYRDVTVPAMEGFATGGERVQLPRPFNPYVGYDASLGQHPVMGLPYSRARSLGRDFSTALTNKPMDWDEVLHWMQEIYSGRPYRP